MILGERTRKKYQLADRVNIKVVRVDIETSKIDFALAGDIQTAPKAFVPMEKVETVLPKGVVRPTQPTAKAVVPPVNTNGKKAKKFGAQQEVEVEPVAPKQKTIITFTSANPPTTPVAGFATGKEKTAVKVRQKVLPPVIEPKSTQAKKAKPAPATSKTVQGKSKSTGALLNKKVGSKAAVSKTKSKKK